MIENNSESVENTEPVENTELVEATQKEIVVNYCKSTLTEIKKAQNKISEFKEFQSDYNINQLVIVDFESVIKRLSIFIKRNTTDK